MKRPIKLKSVIKALEELNEDLNFIAGINIPDGETLNLKEFIIMAYVKFAIPQFKIISIQDDVLVVQFQEADIDYNILSFILNQMDKKIRKNRKTNKKKSK